MNVDELQSTLNRCRKKVLQQFIARAHGHFVGREAIVTVTLTENCTFEDVEDVEEWLMNALAHKLANGQTIEFFWQLMR